jgi:hypothetical protein
MVYSTQQTTTKITQLTKNIKQIDSCIIKFYTNTCAEIANRSKNNIDVAINCARNGQVNQCRKLSNNVKKNLYSITSYIPDIHRNYMNSITTDELKYISKNVVETFLYYWIVKNTITLARRQIMKDQINERNQRNFIYY